MLPETIIKKSNKNYSNRKQRFQASQTLVRTRQEAALQSAIKKQKKNSATSEIRTCDLDIKQSLTLTTQQWTPNRNKTLATNKAKNRCYGISNATVKLPNK